MKSAKEMFEQLGFELVHDNDFTMRYEKTDYLMGYGIPDEPNEKYIIRFYKVDKRFLATESRQGDDEVWHITNYFIDLPTFSAIYQQVKELGWLDE